MSVNALANGQNIHAGVKRGNGAMRQRPKTAPKPANPGSMRSRWQAPPAVKIVELAEYVKEKTANGEMCFKLDYEVNELLTLSHHYWRIMSHFQQSCSV